MRLYVRSLAFALALLLSFATPVGASAALPITDNGTAGTLAAAPLPNQAVTENAADYKGKTVSILGASISTYTGISNNTSFNATIGENAVYYTEGKHGVYSGDTWWMQAANDLGLRLLVNNSWSGSSLLYERNGTVGAYVDRCVQLHNNDGEEPDIIAIQMGTNDFQYYKDTLGTADINYGTLISRNADGSYSYATPTTSLEAAAIVLHKISVRYPNAEVYYLNISQRVDGTDDLIRSFNAELKQVVEYFGAHIVDIYGSAITMDSFDTYISDGRVHPNKLGMDAYTEAFKRSLVANTEYKIDTHTVTLQLDGVTADYGDHKIVVSGDSFSVNLTSTDSMAVTVTMGGTDITPTAYANGTVTIDSVTADVTITAESVHIPKDYRWEFTGTDLVCVSGDNALTKNAGTTTDGVFSKTRYALTNSVVLLHDQPWVVEWKCEGTFLNTNGSSGARIFTSDDVNANYNARYIFKSNTGGIIAMGEKTASGSHNYGIALADYGIDWTALHTYRLENRIAADGSNMVWLYVDGEEIGPMNHYYVGTTDKNTTSDWLSGKDFTFPYMGTDTHGFTNASIEYVQVTECVHTYENGVCTECGAEHPDLANYEGKVISILGDSISTFAGYIPVADGFNLEHLPRYPQDDLLTDVNETWWMQVIAGLGAKLGINDSWRGATLSGYAPVTTGTSGENAAMANLTRIANLGSNGTPDVILLYGGTNDLAHVSKIGAFDPATAPTEADLTAKKWDNLADGFVHTLLRLRHYYPDAIIVAMLPTYTASYYSDAKLAEGNAVMAAICEHYGIPYVDLRDSGVTASHLPDGIHPGAEGMDLITEAVLDVLLNECEVEAGENVVYSVKHLLSGAESSLSYYKGVSANKSFVTAVTGEDLSVTVTMGGTDITSSVYADGLISIPKVTGDIVITAQGRIKPVYEDHLQDLPQNTCAGTNLWKLLAHDTEYYTVDGWGVHPSGQVRSVTLPMNAGDRLWATSFGKSGTNGGTINGIRLTWFSKNGVLKSMSADETYAEFTANGYLSAPEGAVAVNVPMWTSGDENELYILNRGHAYENGACTACGAKNPNPYAGKTISCVGDSITCGVGVTTDQTDYVYLLAQQLGMDYVRLGVSGTTLCTDGSRTCNVGKLTEENLAGADVVTILMGINDFCAAGKGYYELGDISSTDSSTIYGAAHMWCQRIVELRRTESLKNTEFYFVTPVITSWNNSVSSARNWDQSKTNIHGYTLRDLCNAILEVCALYDIPVIDLNLISGLYYNSAEDNTVTEFGGDGVHPGTVGHQMMADAIASRLLQRHLQNDHDHSYGSWITTTYPDCVAGEQQRVCSVCTATEKQVLNGRGHTYGAWTEVTAPTCDAEGQDKRACADCGDLQYRDTRISGDPNKIQVSNPVEDGFFEGKVIMAIGDSLTAGTLTTSEERYHYLTAQALGMTNINSGTSGATLCPGGYLPNKFDTLMTAELLTKRNVDVVTIFLGVNDWNNGVLNGTYRGSLKYDPEDTWYDLGEFGTDDTTIYGAAKMWCERILELQATEECKDVQFVFMTPVILSRNRSLHTLDDWSQDKTNVFGYTLRQYCTAIMEVCAYYGVPVLDLNMYSGMYYHSETDNNVEKFGGDGIHPGPGGHAMMADALTEFLREGYTYEARSVANCGHSYESTDTESTCTTGGYTTYSCPECYYSYTGNCTAAKGHSYENGICTSCGATLGDVSGEGKLTALDLAIINAYLEGTLALKPAEIAACDVNRDGSVTEDDLITLGNRILGK